MIYKFVQTAKEAFPQLKILQDEPLCKHTSFRIGGPAKVMVFPENIEELAYCRMILSNLNIEPLILGAGSNILAPDSGLDRVIICLKDNFEKITLLDENRIEAYAGATLAKVAVAARTAGLTGLEFSHGIPGTVGGGIYMNAGAYGGELREVTEKVTVLDKDGSLREIICDAGSFGYRTSIFEGKDSVIVKAVFKLSGGDPLSIQQTMMELMNRRRTSQPLDLPSAGSTFKRPVGAYAAALIDEAGLKGLRIGDAAVSEKHAGFVVNLGEASANDVLMLMEEIKKRVMERSGIELQPEVRIW